MRGKYEPRPFINPENTQESYSGRGRHPKWLTMFLEKTGKQLVNQKGEWLLVSVEDTQVAQVAD